MKSGIYCIKNTINNKIYIGSAINLQLRINRHIRDLRNNRHSNRYLQRAWNKQWGQHFEFYIIEYAEPTREKLLTREQWWLNITWCWKLEIGYNVSPTAGNSLGVKHTEETRKNMSLAKQKMTEETKILIGQTNKGKKLSEEHKRKIGIGGKGKKRSKEFCERMSKLHSNKTRSPEARERARIYMTGRKRGKYNKLKWVENFKGPDIRIEKINE